MAASEVPVSEQTSVPKVLKESLQVHPIPDVEVLSLAAHLTSHAWPSQRQPSSSRPSCTHVCSLLELSCHETGAGRSPLGATAR